MNENNPKQDVKKQANRNENMGIYGNGHSWHGVEQAKPWKWIPIVLSWVYAVNAFNTGNPIFAIGGIVGVWLVVKFLI